MNAEMFEKRLLECVDKIGGVGKACEAAGITYTTLTRWKDGTSDPKMSNILAFAKAAGVSLDWLMTGAGDPTDTAPMSDPTQDLPARHVIFQDEFVLIPMYDIEVSAGNGLFTQGVTEPIKHVAYRRDWLRSKGLDSHHLAVVCNSGDSMYPTIPNGSCMLVNLLKNTAHDGNIYVIRMDDRIFVKRTQSIPKGGLRIISDNDTYTPFDLDRAYLGSGQFEVCGEVVEISHEIAS